MEINGNILKPEEKIYLKLRELYTSYGYRSYKMSKFEEYDLYGRNKNFLVSDGVITFTDTNGKLMALKPDVTLSIVKNADVSTGVQRLYYSENVYRVSDSVHRYKEIMQTGLEMLGDLKKEDIEEAVLLAALSLKTISDSSALTLSHLGIAGTVLERNSFAAKELTKIIGEKNPHEVKKVCEEYGISAEDEAILSIIATEKSGFSAAEKIAVVTSDEKIKNAAKELVEIAEKCTKKSGISVKIDLSVIGDIRYYNGLIMNGFVSGIPDKVLSGGQYDGLVKKLKKDAQGIGFAVYLDTLERFDDEKRTENKKSKFINVALPKGRLGKEVYKRFEAAGLGVDDILSPDTRKLVFENEENGMRFFWVKPSDVAIYVERGAADIGVCGKDILLEYNPDVYELLDLDIGKCRLCVAGKKDFCDDREFTLRVATKFPNVAMDYYAKKGRDIDIIKLNGSIELAPILGLSDVIVDIVETGTTLRENNLEALETIVPVSARLISNKASYVFKKDKIAAITEVIKG